MLLIIGFMILLMPLDTFACARLILYCYLFSRELNNFPGLKSGHKIR